MVVTSFNPDYPLIRFATGDLSAVLPGTSPCGRTNMRIKGWMGRADQTTKVKGMFVHPGRSAGCCAATISAKARLVVDRGSDKDEMTPEMRGRRRRRRPGPGGWPTHPRAVASCAARSSSWPPAACPTTAR